MSEMTEIDTEAVTLSADEVVEITREVWSSFLGIDLEPLHLDDVEAPGGAGMAGAVGISGAWNGSVTVEAAVGHAQAAAEAMFAAEPGSLAPEEVADAWGELTNMVGGNIKSLFPAPCALSVPAVSDGVSGHVLVPGARGLQRVRLLGPDALVRVTVWQV